MFIHKEDVACCIYICGELPVKTSSPYRHLDIWNTSSCSRWYLEAMQSKVSEVPIGDLRLELTNPTRPSLATSD